MNLKKRRIVKQGSIQHIYQNKADRTILFYDLEDYLVLYTIISITAKSQKVTLLGICLMIDHIHLLAEIDMADTLCRFVKSYTIIFARAYNSAHNKHGRVLRRTFGSASKLGNKKIKTAISYLYNNPVEKKIVSKAQDYRWNFLAYANSQHPFSRKIILRNISQRLYYNIRLVKFMYINDQWLSYSFISNIFKDLDQEESDQLIDYIISLYCPIDFKKIDTYYGGHDSLILAINSNSGSEYDIHEDYNTDSDTVYDEIKSRLSLIRPNQPVRSVTILGEKEKLEIMKLLLIKTSAKKYQIEKFLQIDRF